VHDVAGAGNDQRSDMAELGELLQQARAYKGVTLREAERATRISRLYLEALEADDYDQLPPAAYARGIVRNYATYLGLDPKTVITLYDKGAGQPDARPEVVPAVTDLKVRSHWAPNFAIIAFMVVISAIVFAWMYSAYFQES
jgi:cytoskeletal protein RodZ